MTRRHTPRPRGIVALAAVLVALPLAGCGAAGEPIRSDPPAASAAPSRASTEVETQLAALEAEFGARVGVSALDTGDGRRAEYRQDERFGYASTVKVLAAAVMLADSSAEQRATLVQWTAGDADAAGYSPMTSARVGDGLTLDQLAEAAVRESDNLALNLVLDRIGGPAGLGTALRGIGDATTDPVDIEPALSTVAPGSTANTTTPSAMTADLAAILTGDLLERPERDLLVEWMTGNATGDRLIRAGAPDGWVVADKSGGAGGIRNDVALVTPPGREPLVVTVFTTRTDPSAAYDDALVERTAQVVLAAFAE